jgi:two-component system cell cycle sensor histidine kinase/response regulator CckA
MNDKTEPRLPGLPPDQTPTGPTPSPAPRPSPAPEADTAGAAAIAPGPLLVVDDDDMVRWGTVRKLRGAGYQVLEAADADEALICMQQHGAQVSLMLCDVIMPKRNGYELGQEVRTRWPHAHVVLISGYTPVAMDRHGIQTAGFQLLHKPVPDLPSVIARLIGPPQST